MRRTIPPALVLSLALALGGCAPPHVVAEAPPQPPVVTDGAFTMADGARLPYREWLPAGAPAIVVLALHGIDDSRDAWEAPGPLLAAQGIAVIAPDERGFGATPGRGYWPGTPQMLSDARAMTLSVRQDYPDAKLYLMGESMGGAVLLALAASPEAPAVDGYVFSSPAVWGRQQMNLLYRSTLWLAEHTVPNMRLTGGGTGVVPTDNDAAWERLSRDPLTVTDTRVSTVKGLVDLMDQALAGAGHINAPALFLYGGHDELVPKPAMTAAWRAAARSGDLSVTLAFYPKGYHLLQRDHEGPAVTADIAHWLQDPQAPLPSGADKRARDWIAGQPTS
ncbi:alpha/beta fold hydrolase [Acidisoma cellulosilytica]|uniref:Alpha/beta fold hydrolase n=1 Tax=Acidisoma cellulosilyticum TaxID=2802395 RepID=A0A963Z2R6_9PROT|nr:alpha/beta fold hydrolase [Acidisoma cellulosilyticum]MCB8881782.1 alpha/beta fold hydrolase [Acidisoma cellulosilyticum]